VDDSRLMLPSGTLIRNYDGVYRGPHVARRGASALVDTAAYAGIANGGDEWWVKFQR
jgi:hypothetical protein